MQKVEHIPTICSLKFFSGKIRLASETAGNFSASTFFPPGGDPTLHRCLNDFSVLQGDISRWLQKCMTKLYISLMQLYVNQFTMVNILREHEKNNKNRSDCT